MRISDWSSDVCSSDLTADAMFTYPEVFKVGIAESGNHDNLSYEDDWAERYHGLLVKKKDGTTNYTGQDNAAHAKNLKGKLLRSEEYTSELQSLMRISYAVFCLKNTTKPNKIKT